MYFSICNVYTCISIISNLYWIKYSHKWYIKYIKRWSNVWYSYLNVPTLCEIQTAKLRPLLGAQRLFVVGFNRATGPLSSRSRLKDCSMLQVTSKVINFFSRNHFTLISDSTLSNSTVYLFHSWKRNCPYIPSMNLWI